MRGKGLEQIHRKAERGVKQRQRANHDKWTEEGGEEIVQKTDASPKRLRYIARKRKKAKVYSISATLFSISALEPFKSSAAKRREKGGLENEKRLITESQHRKALFFIAFRVLQGCSSRQRQSYAQHVLPSSRVT
jgi:hypothetical protein